MSGRKPQFAGGAQARYLMLGSALVLTIVGVIMVFSSSYVGDLMNQGNVYDHGLRQLVYAVVGLGIVWFVSRFDYRRLGQFARVLWWGSVALLVVTYALGYASHGAKRWLDFGPISVQPSEIAKLSTLVLLAWLASQWQKGKLDDREFTLWAVAGAALPSVLIVLQPDLGTTISLLVGVLAVLWFAEVPVRRLAQAAALVAVVGVIGIAIEPYRIERVLSFMKPSDPLDEGYQIMQALLAFGTGGIDGVGLGLSRQKFFYLPEANTDFIFAIIGEELGLFGTLAVVAAFAIFIYAGIRIAIGTKDTFGRVLAGALTVTIGFQAFMNMAAVTGIMPVTGKPLPFISSGGSSLLVNMVCVGLLLSISSFGTRVPRSVKKPVEQGEDWFESPGERGRDGRAHLSGADRRREARRRA